MTTTAPPAPFGRTITAMVTPLAQDGSLDLAGAATLADHLVARGCDALVINGTTGEAPTTSDDEKSRLVSAVAAVVEGRAKVIAGVGTYDTTHSVKLARQAASAGADGLLVVSPYYSKPPQAGLIAHFTAVADATNLPVMLYDIPGRTGVALSDETRLRLAAHERIVAIKDATGDVAAASRLLAAAPDIAHYSGDDILTLPFLAVGSAGVVSVAGHLVADRIAAMISAYFAGDVTTARQIHLSLIPVFVGIFRTQGVITTKAALSRLGLPGGDVRLPLVPATAAEIAQLRTDLAAGGVDLKGEETQ